jgi:hypothetical protein
MSWKAEVTTNRAGNWVSNRLRFETIEEATDYVTGLWKRWRMVTDIRVVPCDEPVNYRYINGELLAIVKPCAHPLEDQQEQAT